MYIMLLWLRRNDYRSAANCWKQMMKFQQRFADDEDIEDHNACGNKEDIKFIKKYRNGNDRGP